MTKVTGIIGSGWLFASLYAAQIADPAAIFSWIALALYIDAEVSPSGTGLASTAATARINYAMSKNRQFPEIFGRVNRFKVPIWGLLFKFAVGMMIFLPFPGWSELVGFISSSVVLSFASGPFSLAALRHQIPDLDGARHYNVLSAERTPAVDRRAVSAVSWVPGLKPTYRILTAETDLFGGHPTRTGSCGRRIATRRPVNVLKSPDRDTRGPLPVFAYRTGCLIRDMRGS